MGKHAVFKILNSPILMLYFLFFMFNENPFSRYLALWWCISIGFYLYVKIGILSSRQKSLTRTSSFALSPGESFYNFPFYWLQCGLDFNVFAIFFEKLSFKISYFIVTNCNEVSGFAVNAYVMLCGEHAVLRDTE